MANVETLIEKYKGEIEKETSRYGSFIQTNVPRDPLRRPWHSTPQVIPFPFLHPRTQAGQQAVLQIGNLIRRRWLAGLAGAIIAGLATFMWTLHKTPTYNSSVQIFAPEKIDTVVSRLTVLTSQLEFASLPVSLKMPMSMLSRRLQEDTARRWVISQYIAQRRFEYEEAHFEPSSVAVNTYYEAGTGLLSIQGYANDPKIAARITELYWRYLEHTMDGVRNAYVARIENWIAIRDNILDEEIHGFKNVLEKSFSKIANDGSSPLQVRMRADMAELEMKRLEYEKELAVLKKADLTGDLEELRQVSDSEIQQRLEIYRTIENGDDDTPDADVYQDQSEAIANEIRGLVKNRISNLEIQLQSVHLDRERFGQKLEGFLTVEGREQVESESVRDMQLRLRGLESQRADLDKLKTQLEIDRIGGSSSLEAVHSPEEDPGTLRPTQGVLNILICIGCIGGAILGLCLAQLFSGEGLPDILRGFFQSAPTPRLSH